ncbi:MAG: DUF2997 domain-containing protein [Candidatus Parcubacteria bacterium]|uniref:DUF2997 domain-containing protein n=1 Tax=Phormidesmis priestleyi TaxID=268141 RepID=UPI00083A321D|nr:DUF2997 domain-containing protein [Phormidesmis priestleyi]MBC7823700.1 DUF2997 domain-containing protein [Leptolyngbyaceae cyanobacterium LF-bin-113]
MTDYQKIEYRIGKDGKIVETVLNGLGATCTDLTSEIEHSIGTIESQTLLPEYYEGDEFITVEDTQTLQQGGI